MRRFGFLTAMRGATVALGATMLTGCIGPQRTPPMQVWPDMRMQARFETQATSGLFEDGRASRRRPDGVVAHGHLAPEDTFDTGLLANGDYAGKSPVEITPAVLAEGEWRFNTYCAPCHDRTGLGNGMVPQRATTLHPANLTDDRLVNAADGDLFTVISYGRRTMPPYGEQNRPAERWAIVAWVRVLQRAQHGKVSDVPEAERANLTFKAGLPPIPQVSLEDLEKPAKGGAKQ